ncbi:MAG: chemotaxis protein CheW [Steroidobacteraceae bacterium]
MTIPIPAVAPPAGAKTAASQQILTFSLGAETYGVEILRVQEIRGFSTVTRIPQAPPHVLGVLNLRGTIVPIVDLRMRFSLAEVAFTALTVIMVLSVEGGSGRRNFGLVVDGVSDVMDLAPDAVRPTPEFGSHVNTDFIRGLATLGDSMVMLLDIDRLIGDDLREVSQAA